MSDVEPAPEPSVRINLSTIYAEVVQQGKTNVKIDAKLDRVLAELHDARRNVDDHESRLRSLEADRVEAASERGDYVTRKQAAWWLGTAIAGVMAVTGVLALFFNR